LPPDSTPHTVGAALEAGRFALTSVSDSAGLDAQVLLARASGIDRAWLLAHPEATLPPEQAGIFLSLLARCAQGESLPYVVGEWEFFGRAFRLTPEVLIPRPETELLVEAALEFLAGRPDVHLAADVGTGSGCIAVSLLAENPGVTVLATDISRAALEIARQNALRHQVTTRFRAAQMDLLTATRARYHLICANLPYIPSQTVERLPVGRREPRLALDGGPDGTTYIRRLLDDLPRCLAPGGRALLEVGDGQGSSARAHLESLAPRFRERLLKDLAGLERVLVVDRDGA
jgi:release factor glutamine methyltransferase